MWAWRVYRLPQWFVVPRTRPSVVNDLCILTRIHSHRLQRGLVVSALNQLLRRNACWFPARRCAPGCHRISRRPRFAGGTSLDINRSPFVRRRGWLSADWEWEWEWERECCRRLLPVTQQAVDQWICSGALVRRPRTTLDVRCIGASGRTLRQAKSAKPCQGACWLLLRHSVASIHWVSLATPESQNDSRCIISLAFCDPRADWGR